jgi:ribonuclease P protein component
MQRLTRRAEFLAARDGPRASAGTFLLQAKKRRDAGGPRVGFTVSKKTGSAVERNRIRRRLREAARNVIENVGKPGFDYVLVARRDVLAAPFATLVRELERALRKVHASAG